MTDKERVKLKGEALTIDPGLFLHGVPTAPESLDDLRTRLRGWFMAYLHQNDGCFSCGPFPNQVDLYEALDDYLLHLDKQLNR